MLPVLSRLATSLRCQAPATVRCMSSAAGKLRKTTQLKKLLSGYDKNMGFLMEAHNGLSAKIVEEAGFKGIWWAYSMLPLYC